MEKLKKKRRKINCLKKAIPKKKKFWNKYFEFFSKKASLQKKLNFKNFVCLFVFFSKNIYIYIFLRMKNFWKKFILKNDFFWEKKLEQKIERILFWKKIYDKKELKKILEKVFQEKKNWKKDGKINFFWKKIKNRNNCQKKKKKRSEKNKVQKNFCKKEFGKIQKRKSIEKVLWIKIIFWKK